MEALDLDIRRHHNGHGGMCVASNDPLGCLFLLPPSTVMVNAHMWSSWPGKDIVTRSSPLSVMVSSDVVH